MVRSPVMGKKIKITRGKIAWIGYNPQGIGLYGKHFLCETKVLSFIGGNLTMLEKQLNESSWIHLVNKNNISVTENKLKAAWWSVA